jgi:hypothetical protein
VDIIQTVTATLQEQLGDHLDLLARQCGVVCRERKFTGQTLLRMLVLTLLRKPDATSGDFFATALAEGLDVSATAVDKRLQAGQPLIDFLRQAVVVLYRSRWQIELLFKLWKSHNGLDRLRVGASALHPLAVFYAKLLGVLLQHWLLLALVWQIPQRSLMRAAQRLREYLQVLTWVLDDGAQLQSTLQRLRQQMERLARTQERRKKPSHAELLEDPELLDWLTGT